MPGEIDFLLEVFREKSKADAIIHRNEIYTYAWLVNQIEKCIELLKSKNIPRGAVVSLESDFSAQAIAWLLAIISDDGIVVPITTLLDDKIKLFRETSQAEWAITLGEGDSCSIEKLNRSADHELYSRLRHDQHPGLVLFSSGSTGMAKAAVHDLVRLLKKFNVRRHDFRTLTFLLFDHIGGVDTMLYSLSNGSAIVTVEERAPDSVCRTIQDHRVEVLPVTPSFLNLLILSDAIQQYDLSSLKYIAYGTEIMHKATLQRVAELFPHVTLIQKFGATEVGTLRSKSEKSDSVWVKLGGEGYETRVVDSVLHIHAKSAMLGYLNAKSPFTSDGWFVTGDLVEQRGEYIRFLGRESEIINVGGEKVHPLEVENVIRQMKEVVDVIVYSKPNMLLGQSVCAQVALADDVDKDTVIKDIKIYCSQHLERHQIPALIEIVDEIKTSERFKKTRRAL